MKITQTVFASFLLFTALTVVPASAQNSSLSSSQGTNSNCSQSQLTQDQFIDVVRAIAMHGDLTDVAFIEKTLQVKLMPQTLSEYEKEHYPDGRHYLVDSVLGSRMRFDLGVGFNSNEHDWDKEPKENERSTLRFFVVQNAFHDCKSLTPEHFNSRFGGNFFNGPAGTLPLNPQTGEMSSGGALQGGSQNFAGKDGTKMNVSYMCDAPDGSISLLAIMQRPQQGERK